MRLDSTILPQMYDLYLIRDAVCLAAQWRVYFSPFRFFENDTASLCCICLGLAAANSVQSFCEFTPLFTVKLTVSPPRLCLLFPSYPTMLFVCPLEQAWTCCMSFIISALLTTQHGGRCVAFWSIVENLVSIDFLDRAFPTVVFLDAWNTGEVSVGCNLEPHS